MTNDFVADWDALAETDPDVAGAIANEVNRERSTLRLIASENYASPAVLAAQASTMNNKYAEGYPGRRYYGGCEFVDVVETLAIERAKRLFGADHANVQPHAGAQANLAVFGAFLEPRSNDKVLGLVLAFLARRGLHLAGDELPVDRPRSDTSGPDLAPRAAGAVSELVQGR